MSTNFPTSLDTYTNPVGTDTLDSPDHAAQHANVNDAVEALETKVGVDGSAVTTTHDYKLSTITGSDKTVGVSATQTLTNKTLTSPAITNASSTGADSGTETLTNKTIDGNNNTLTVLAASQLSGATPIANGGTGQTTQTAGFDALSPTTTKGDILVDDGTNVIRLPIGSNTQVLTADSAEASGVKWSSAEATTTPVVQVYTAGDTWTKPAGLAYVIVEVVGGGGAGATGTTGGRGGGGGGGGGYAKKLLDSSVLGATETITVGAATATSSFTVNGGSTVTATGGANASTVTGGVGGVGSNGDANVGGTDGAPANVPDGNIGVGGNGGNTVLGGGGRGASSNLANGEAGNAYGAGGGGGGTDGTGGSSASSGGAGASGVVIVTEFY